MTATAPEPERPVHPEYGDQLTPEQEAEFERLMDPFKEETADLENFEITKAGLFFIPATGFMVDLDAVAAIVPHTSPSGTLFVISDGQSVFCPLDPAVLTAHIIRFTESRSRDDY